MSKFGLAHLITTIAALPFVVYGGVALVSGIYVAKEDAKLRKQIRKNSGKASSYGKDSTDILAYYKNDITGVIEPKTLGKYLVELNKVKELVKLVESYRNAFKQIDLDDPRAEQKAKKLGDEIKKYIQKLDSCRVADSDDHELIITDEKIIPLAQSNIIKISKFEDEIFQFVIPKYPDSVLAYINEDDVTDDEEDEYINKLKLAELDYIDAKLTDSMGKIEDKVADIVYACIKACKFAVRKRAKKSKS